MSIDVRLPIEEWVKQKVLILHRLEVARLTADANSYFTAGYKLDDLVVIQCDRGPSKIIVNPTNGVLRGVCP